MTDANPSPPPDKNPPSNMGPNALQAPWRLAYIESLGKPVPHSGNNPPASSFLNAYWTTPRDDEKNHVIVRTGSGMILLNAHPYSNGHLLIALGTPKPRLLDYLPAERAGLWKLVELATDLMENTLNCQGINLGINQGQAAGAGVPDHLHVHLVPRWASDTNFITTVGQIRVIPMSLEAMDKRYRQVWKKISS